MVSDADACKVGLKGSWMRYLVGILQNGNTVRKHNVIIEKRIQRNWERK